MMPEPQKKQAALSPATALACALVLGCVLIAAFEAAFQPAYAVKSAVKVALFTGLPLLASRLCGGGALGVLRPIWRKEALLAPLLLGVAVYAAIVGGYFLLRRWVDFSGIAGAQGASGIDRGNLAYVALYVCLVNCPLEEFFFRGAGYLALRQAMGDRPAMLLSSACFCAYHVAIMDGWFAPLPFVGLLAALFAAGLFLCYIDKRANSPLPAWAVHLFANAGIYTVAFLLF